MSVAELQQALRDRLCFTNGKRFITAEVLGIDDMRAKFMGSNGVGFNHIDLDAGNSGSTVTNTPVLTDCTADLTMTLLLGRPPCW